MIANDFNMRDHPGDREAVFSEPASLSMQDQMLGEDH